MTYENSCVAVYDEHLRVQEALHILQKNDVNTTNLSLLGKGEGSGTYSTGLYTRGDQVQYRGAQRFFWEEMWRYLPGAAFFWIPTVGTVVVAGSLGAALVVALEEVVNGPDVLGAALYTVGVPDDSVIGYEKAIREGRYLLVVQAEQNEAERVHDLLLSSDVQDMALHLG
ncbi:MAG: permease [Gammaproteobacteria bacterium]|nr:permease [Gammaproteobacteria bacterium]